MKIAVRILLAVIFLSHNYAWGAGAISAKAVGKVDSLMNAGLKAGYYPGATIAVGNSSGILYQKCYGWHDYLKTEAVSDDDIYDIASCTKIVSTTLELMYLYDQGIIRLDMKLGSLLTAVADSPIAGITVKQLLTHTSGLGNIAVYSFLFTNPQGGPLISNTKSTGYPYAVDTRTYLCVDACADEKFICLDPREGYRKIGENCYVNPQVDELVLAQIIKSYNPSKRGQYFYSDLNFHLLKLAIEEICGRPLDECVAPLFAGMNMKSTGYHPLQWKPVERIVPTENDILMQRGLLRGYTHDEIAAVSGVGGNAGLFSNTSDLANYCSMILNKGRFGDEQIVSPETIKFFTTATPRALGFNRPNDKTALTGGFGHTGYTGTIIWIDPSRDLFMVFLSNRVNPSRTNQGLSDSALRTKLWEAATSLK